MEHYDPWERLRAWELVVERGVPIGFGAQSVGAFKRRRERGILARVYGAAVVIGLREHESVAHVMDLGAPAERVVVTADEAFSLFPLEHGARSPRAGIACVLSAHPWLRVDGSLVHPSERLDSLEQLLRELVELSRREHVTILSTQQGLGHLSRGLEDDSEFAAAIVARLPRRRARRIRLVEGYLPPLACARLIENHRGLVSMRMHPAIFGLSTGVPTVLVSDAFKATGVFDLLGLRGAVVSGPELAAERLETLGRRPLSERFDLEGARRRAAANDEVIQRLLAAAAAPARRSPPRPPSP
jgi:polysaccharide pyruvyl transferase WcaK-like protein